MRHVIIASVYLVISIGFAFGEDSLLISKGIRDESISLPSVELKKTKEKSSLTNSSSNACVKFFDWHSDSVVIGAYKLSNPENTPLEKMKAEIQEMKQIGFDFAMFDVWGLPNAPHLQPLLDYADRQKFSLVPHLSAIAALLRELDSQGKPTWKRTPKGAKPPVARDTPPYIYGIGEESWAQRWKDGSIVYEGAWKDHPYPFPDMWAPVARNMFRDVVRQAANVLANHPGVKMISYDDEYRYWFDFIGNRGIPIHSPWSQKVVSALSVTNSSLPKEPLPSGYVANGQDPFTGIRYTIGHKFFHFTDPSIDFHATDLSKVLHGHTRGVSDFFSTGAFGAGTDIVMCRAYSTERYDPILADAFAYDYAHSVSGGQAKMFDLIGWWQKQKDWHCYSSRIRKAARLVLMRGPDGITFAPTTVLLSVPEMREQLVAAIKDIRKFGPLFRRIELQRPKIGMLWSDTTLSHQQLENSNWLSLQPGDKNRNWRWEEHKLSAHIAYSALWQAGYLPRVITEEDILDGVLNDLDVLVLINHQFSETRLVREYESFIKRGKLVLADKSSSVVPSNAIVLDSDCSRWCRAMEAGKRNWWDNNKDAYLKTYNESYKLIQKMAIVFRKALEGNEFCEMLAEKDSANPVVVATAKGAGAKYLIALNSDMLKKHNVEISFQHEGPMYNLVQPGKKTAIEKDSDGKNRMKLSMSPEDWGIWLLAERPIAKVGALLVNAKCPAVVRCQLWDDEGFPMRGVVPFCVRVSDQVHWGVAEHGVGTLWIWRDIGEEDNVIVDVLGRTVYAERMPNVTK